VFKSIRDSKHSFRLRDLNKTVLNYGYHDRQFYDFHQQNNVYLYTASNVININYLNVNQSVFDNVKTYILRRAKGFVSILYTLAS